MKHDRYPKWDYKEYPKTLAANDLWGQVRRTVYGKPVPEEQIKIIVDAIVAGLELQTTTVLLDIGCGNAALTARLFPHCAACLGVDSSEYLISVASTRFASSIRTFICQDAVEYTREEAEPLRFNRALCFGVFAYLSDDSARQMLTFLGKRFLNIGLIYLGSIPDPDRAASFFKGSDLNEVEFDNPQSQIGVWRSRERMTAMVAGAGWHVRFQDMSPNSYQAHYRYNAILERLD